MIVVNFFAGPGAGKSTCAAGVFYKLKLAGINAELVLEFAKDLTWEARHSALAMQPYVFGEQYYRLKRLEGKVAVVVTDSPLLLSRVYRRDQSPPSFIETVGDYINEFTNVNFFVERQKAYNPAGRNQTEAEAWQFDGLVREALDEFCGKKRYSTVPGNDEGTGIAASYVKYVLQTPVGQF